MDSEDKRHIQKKYGRVSVAFPVLLALVACRSQADAPAHDADVADASRAPSTELALDAAVRVEVPPPSSIYGEWERQSDPYRGMRIVIREREATVRVSRSSTVDPKAKNKAQLECQRTLWKPGDVVMTGFDGAKATLVVRDWGLTGGICRHQDTKAEVDFIRPEPDVLALTVWRGQKPVVQEWSRVTSP